MAEGHKEQSDSVFFEKGTYLNLNDAKEVIDRFSEAHIYYDGEKIRPAFLGQTLDFRISFWVKRLSPNAQISFTINIRQRGRPD